MPDGHAFGHVSWVSELTVLRLRCRIPAFWRA
jgi:hypothetical protein